MDLAVSAGNPAGSIEAIAAASAIFGMNVFIILFPLQHAIVCAFAALAFVWLMDGTP